MFLNLLWKWLPGTARMVKWVVRCQQHSSRCVSDWDDSPEGKGYAPGKLSHRNIVSCENFCWVKGSLLLII